MRKNYSGRLFELVGNLRGDKAGRKSPQRAGFLAAVFAAFIVAAATLGSAPVSAQDFDEAALDEMFLSGDGSSGSSSAASSWEVDGYAESENFFGAEEQSTYKLEGRSRVNIKYGGDLFFAYASLDIFFYPTQSQVNAGRSSGEIDPYEFYIAGGENLRFKVGKQTFLWSKADAFQLQNYLNQRDLREMFLKENDERYRGIFGLSLKYLYKDFVIEGALSPFFTPVLYPAAGSIWALDFSKLAEGPSDPLNQARFEPASSQDYALEKASWAVRAGGAFGAVDFYVSYYNGVNSGVILVPEARIPAPFNVPPREVVLRPYNPHVQKGGAAVAVTWGKLAARGEAIYSHDYPVLYADEGEATAELTTDELDQPELSVTRKVGRTPYFAYTTGFDYNLWGNYGRVLVEYTSSMYLQDADLYEEEFFNNFILLRVEDRFFYEKLELSASAIFRSSDPASGFIPTGSITWFVKDSLSLTLGAVPFISEGDKLMQIYDDKDVVFFRAKMSF